MRLRFFILCFNTFFFNKSFVTGIEPAIWHCPTIRPPAPLKPRWMRPRIFVLDSRISQVIFLFRMRSIHGFFTTKRIFVDRRNALLRQCVLGRCFPFVRLPAFPTAPLAALFPLAPTAPALFPLFPTAPLEAPFPLFPTAPLAALFPLFPTAPLPALLPPNVFRFKLAKAACLLKQSLQYLVRWDFAALRQPSILHFGNMFTMDPT